MNPLPHQQQQEQDQQQSYNKTAQSAPQHGGHRLLYRRANSAVQQQHTHDTTNNDTTNALVYPDPTAAPRSYHHQRHHYLHRAHKAQSSDNVDGQQLQQQQQQQRWQQLNPLQEEFQPLSFPGRMKDIEQQPLKNTCTNGSVGLSSKTKNLSGLSLALMLSDEQSLSLNSADAVPSENGDTMEEKDNQEGKEEKPAIVETNAAAEKRRAALHNAPPLFNALNHAGVSASPRMTGGLQVAATTTGEYGYAYNNHIPTLQQQEYGRGANSNGSKSPGTPNTNNTSSALGLQGPHFPTTASYTTSPSLRPMTPLGSTPPGYLLSATPSTGMTGPITPNSVGSGGLIPPRSSVTPPFVRPIGFVGEAPSHPVPSTAGNGTDGAGVGTDNVISGSNSDTDAALQHHQTSLDLLHSSPFQLQPSHAYYSQHANTSFGSRIQQHYPYQFTENYSENGFGAPFMSEFYHRSGNLTDDTMRDRGNSEAFLDHDLADDMPFAVDPIMMCTSTATPNTAGTASVGVVASNQNVTRGNGLASMMNEASLMASMCTVAPKRLAMFDSKLHTDEVPKRAIPTNNSGSIEDGIADGMADVMDSLADQLAEFKSFGASLSVESAARMTNSNAPFAPEAPTASAGSG
jgi:hypothetical protein